MAYSNNEKEKFIELRTQGKSFDEIAQILNVGRSTLFNWQADFRKELQELRFTEYDALARKHHLTRKEKLQREISLLEKVDSQIDSADLSKLDIKELFKLREKTLSKIDSELNSVGITVGGMLMDFLEKEQGINIGID